MDNIFKKFSPEEIEEAKVKLDALCREHGVKPFGFDDKRGWKKLVLAMIGLSKTANAGRKPLIDQEIKDYMCGYMDIVDEFSFIDDDGNETIKQTSLKEKFDTFEKKIKVADYTPEAHKNKTFTGRKSLENYWKNKGKKRLEQIEQERIEEQENSDWS